MSLIAQYRSPSNETSVVKGVPVSLQSAMIAELQSTYPTKQFRARFRGPRYDPLRSHCLKKDAKNFAVYFQ